MLLRTLWLQTWAMTIASIKSRYRKTFAGFIWVLMSPVLIFAVQALVFKRFLRLEIPDFFIFFLSGLLPWIFFNQTIQMGTPIFASQSQLLKSFKINPLVLLGAHILDSFFNFLASLLLILLPFYFFSERSIYPLFYLPLALIPLLLATLSVTITLSVLNIFYRDINFVMGFLFSLLYFLTPIFYPKEYVPQDLRWLVDYNVILYLIEPFRVIIYYTSFEGYIISIIKSTLVALFFVLLAFIVWKRNQNEFYRKL